MTGEFSRRTLLYAATYAASSALPLRMLAAADAGSLDAAPQAAAPTPNSAANVTGPGDDFPRHAPELVREVVLVAHFNLKRLRELVDTRPSLARAAWDWGFGDWEDALGAASHMGNRAIAEYLIAKGGRPSVFSAAMLGQLDAVKGFIAAQPGVQRIRGPHSISLLAHARAGKEPAKPVFDFLQSLGDADAEPEAPLTPEERAPILGTYVFGASPNQQIDVAVEQNPGMKADQLMWTRKGAMGRPLHHLGNRVFFPAGAAEVRISFAEQNGAIVMTVHDGEPVLTARRRA
jgi:hypothetical protein